MSKNIYIFIDIQNDFVTKENVSDEYISNLANFISSLSPEDEIIFTMETYLDSRGFCDWKSNGWSLPIKIQEAIPEGVTALYVEKDNMIHTDWGIELDIPEDSNIIICGINFDTSVLANSLVIKGCFSKYNIIILKDKCYCINNNYKKAVCSILEKCGIKCV